MKTIEDLRDTLFATLSGLKDGTVDLDRAKAVSDLSQVIINTGKLEVEYIRVTGAGGTGFVPLLEADADGRPARGETVETATGKLTRTATGVVHRMR